MEFHSKLNTTIGKVDRVYLSFGEYHRRDKAALILKKDKIRGEPKAKSVEILQLQKPERESVSLFE